LLKYYLGKVLNENNDKMFFLRALCLGQKGMGIES
jgi:hypothetical protein